MQFFEIESAEHERVVGCVDADIGYRGIIAIHSTACGPAVGGTRLWNYTSDEAALTDVLRLSRGMTYKCAVAGIPLGGGKSIIIGDGATIDRENIFRVHGKFVESLNGAYITAEDVGTSPADMSIVAKETRHVVGLDGQSGDPSPSTARGVFRAIQASAMFAWGDNNVERRTVAIQGCGHVGYFLARELHQAGTRLIVTDIDPESVDRVVSEFGAHPVAPEKIYDVEADVFAPCALGAVFNDDTIPRLRARVISGGANNQLSDPARHGAMLEERGIVYAPDYVANAGGVINGCRDVLGWEAATARLKIDEIYETLLSLFVTSRADGVPTYLAADRLGESRFRSCQDGLSKR